MKGNKTNFVAVRHVLMKENPFVCQTKTEVISHLRQ